MTPFFIAALIWFFVFQYIGYRLLLAWRVTGNDWCASVAICIFLVNGQVAGFIFDCLVRVGAL